MSCVVDPRNCRDYVRGYERRCKWSDSVRTIFEGHWLSGTCRIDTVMGRVK